MQTSKLPGAKYCPFLFYNKIDGMEKETRTNLLSKFLGLPEDANVRFTFNPYDNSIIKIAWNSPNDGKSNLFNMLMNPREITTLRIEDKH